MSGTQLIEPNLVHSLRISENENVRDAELRRRCSGWAGNFMKVYTMLTTNQIFKYFQTCRMCLFGPFKASRASEKAMAPHSSTLAWKIPWTEEPGGLQPVGLLRVGHNKATSFSLFTFMHWRRKWQPTPVFLPGESQGWRSLVGCRLWGRTESDTTEAT